MWSKFGLFSSYYLVQVGVIIWPKVILGLYVVVSSDLCKLSYHFVFFGCPIMSHFSKNRVFEKKVQVFFQISVLSFFGVFLFLCLLKHNKRRGFSNFCAFVVQREEKAPKKILRSLPSGSGLLLCLT